ncbi:hypothetical protein [Streptomyces cyaneofuscatus]|uniref:Lipoprotein n=1 Tax=Streptomyces cyaneofuscatus TaxID=66883 RepID=A0ABZ1F3Z1_9ACTN|nr:hypothetical protein [Streptomyces cyaneofuscatus]WSB11124.1 hypothetical protein OG849_29670 [Streptomyces cyaneofuscatus]WSD45343.1 hypothetical protein OG857_05735 [Streptomyces cyaneofuscatus]WTA88679.1 hypothetical protein OG323_06545 [Streptomyces cyaneofuscatus]
MNRRASSPFIAVAAAIGLAFGTACTAESGADGSAQPSQEASGSPQDTPKATPSGKGEQEDLVSFQLDDRSQAGISDVWVVWTIKNNSSKKSTYTWDWEAVDSAGTRVANSTELVTDVQPGQTSKGEMVTVIKDADGLKLNVTSFNRMASP